MTILLMLFTALSWNCFLPETNNNDAINEKIAQKAHASSYLELSKQLVQRAKNQQDASPIIEQLANAPMQELKGELDSDAAKKAFFINVYNGFVQHILIKNPEKFEDRDKFFKSEQITIAGEALSLDDIEHGIIRGSKVKWSLGLIQDPFADDFEKAFRVEETDPRIHFALNCGARSCPYIAIFDVSKMDEQLDAISRQFLNRTTTYKPEESKVYVTSLISWFRGDFDGLDGAKEMLRRYDIIPEDADPDLEFKDYDWTLELGNYTELDVSQS
ncbi:hypothetical protein OKW21_003464 [Catalinimonas alkaloidigena]|uniref:DUF547 domain-containing protein n=1 Tax=Catalinimonas alkaloidigena TaxID=1075417 RepID=UPI002406B127|nr:DUF547 domain-containing protein [Catalinimonas alkaloidigena]MDF9798201.1 hypothetical protein [Catalinimonas alkaloidigena]